MLGYKYTNKQYTILYNLILFLDFEAHDSERDFHNWQNMSAIPRVWEDSWKE